MLGVATLITVVSVMDGFTDSLKSKFLGANPHIVITRMDAQPLAEWRALIDNISKTKYVHSVAPLAIGQAMISKENTVSGVLVRGIDPEIEARSGLLESTIIRGSLAELNSDDMPTILIGKELMYSQGLIPGREITIISPTMTRGAFGIIPKMQKMKVVGYFDTGIYEHNRTLAYMNLTDAQNFFIMGDNVSAVTVTLSHPDKSSEVASQLQLSLNNGELTGATYWVRDWLSMNESLFAALKLEQYAMFVILTLIIVVASFNIVSMITVTVKDKRKDIAIIRAMGGSEKLIRKAFVRQGLIIGTAGTILGNILALIIALILMNFKIITLPKEIYNSDTIPITLSPEIFIIVTVCAVAITYIASIVPARMSAKTDPIEAIRND
jgi:lipoprotein-releasing system permease protein